MDANMDAKISCRVAYFGLLGCTLNFIFMLRSINASAAAVSSDLGAGAAWLAPGGFLRSDRLHSSSSYRFERLPTGVKGRPACSRRRMVDSLTPRAAHICCLFSSFMMYPLPDDRSRRLLTNPQSNLRRHVG